MNPPTTHGPGRALATTTYPVWGLTCGACLAELIEPVRSLEGVTAVSVDLVKNGASPLVITSTASPSREAVAFAVHKAGFILRADTASRAG